MRFLGGEGYSLKTAFKLFKAEKFDFHLGKDPENFPNKMIQISQNEKIQRDRIFKTFKNYQISTFSLWRGICLLKVKYKLVLLNQRNIISESKSVKKTWLKQKVKN